MQWDYPDHHNASDQGDRDHGAFHQDDRDADASHQDDHDADNASDHKYVLYSLYNEQCAILVKCLLCEIWEVCMNMHCSGTGSGTIGKVEWKLFWP